MNRLPTMSIASLSRHGACAAAFVLAPLGCAAESSSDHADPPAASPEKTAKAESAYSARFYGTATQSSTAFGGTADRAADRNGDGNFSHGSVTHTDYQDMPWWQLDLGPDQGNDRTIATVSIFNRTDCCSERLNNFFVFAKNTPFIGKTPSDLMNENGVTMRIVWGQPTSPVDVDFTVVDSFGVSTGTKARYIRVQLGGTGYLSLAEVLVHGEYVVNSSANTCKNAFDNCTQDCAAWIFFGFGAGCQNCIHDHGVCLASICPRGVDPKPENCP